jgi:hypothetical protein
VAVWASRHAEYRVAERELTGGPLVPPAVLVAGFAVANQADLQPWNGSSLLNKESLGSLHNGM